MKQHVKQCSFSIMEFVASVFSDLCSFRNKITVFVCFLTVYCIYLFKESITVVLTALGMLNSYLMYYLHNRKQEDANKKAPKK